MLYARHRLLVEPELSTLWSNSTSRCCAARDGLVVDAGANFGWYTMLSLSLGCAVVAFEPVNAYQDALRLAVSLNGESFRRRLTVYGSAVFDVPGTYRMVVPQAGTARARNRSEVPHVTLKSHMRTFLGMAAMVGYPKQDAVKDVQKFLPGSRTYTEEVEAVRIDAVVDRAVCMLKIDIEGLEPQGLRSADALLSRAENVQLEVTRKSSQACEMLRMLRDLLLHGFELYRVHHTTACWSSECVLHAAAAARAAARDPYTVADRLSPALTHGEDLHRPPSSEAVYNAWRVARRLYNGDRALRQLYSWNLLARRPSGVSLGSSSLAPRCSSSPPLALHAMQQFWPGWPHDTVHRAQRCRITPLSSFCPGHLA